MFITASGSNCLHYVLERAKAKLYKIAIFQQLPWHKLYTRIRLVNLSIRSNQSRCYWINHEAWVPIPQLVAFIRGLEIWQTDMFDFVRKFEDLNSGGVQTFRKPIPDGQWSYSLTFSINSAMSDESRWRRWIWIELRKVLRQQFYLQRQIRFRTFDWVCR